MKLKLTMSEIFPDDREAIARLLEPYLEISCDHEKTFPHGHGMKINNNKKFGLNCGYFLIHQFKHKFWVLKRAVSLRRFF